MNYVRGRLLLNYYFLGTGDFSIITTKCSKRRVIFAALDFKDMQLCIKFI